MKWFGCEVVPPFCLVTLLLPKPCSPGFIMLGAYQDSRPATPGGPPSVKFGMKDWTPCSGHVQCSFLGFCQDFFVFIVYMAMA